MLHPELMALKKLVVKIRNKILQTDKAVDGSCAPSQHHGRCTGCPCKGSHPSTDPPSACIRPGLPFQRLKLFTETIRREEMVN